jgi:Zn-dependent protease
MRDPMTWSFPVARMFGITVKVHILFVLITLGLIAREAFFRESAPAGAWIQVTILLTMLFFSVLLHELGHCFAARGVDGDATEILMWPLGGLASLDVPHTPRANFITVAGGPAVNLALCAITAILLAFASYLPSLDPFSNPYRQQLYNWREGVAHGSKFNPTMVRETGPGEFAALKGEQTVTQPDGRVTLKDNPAVTVSLRQLTGGVNGLAMFFWVNWVLFLFNIVLVAFPMDGGRLLQCFVWWRTGDYRQGTSVAVTAGFVVSLILVVIGLGWNEALMLALGLFVYVSCAQQRHVLEHGIEEAPFGYDFSQGYTSLEKADAPPKPKRPNFVQRWMRLRAAKKAAKLAEQREYEDRRMDELLEKIQREGAPSLTDEERRFLTRVSARYKHRQ